MTTLALYLTAWGPLAADPDGLDVAAPFLQFGAIGALALLLLAFARGAYQRETKRSDALEEELRRINTELRDRMVPLLTEVARVLADAHTLLRDRR